MVCNRNLDIGKFRNRLVSDEEKLQSFVIDIRRLEVVCNRYLYYRNRKIVIIVCLVQSVVRLANFREAEVRLPVSLVLCKIVTTFVILSRQRQAEERPYN